jgi:hypothetical protein
MANFLFVVLKMIVAEYFISRSRAEKILLGGTDIAEHDGEIKITPIVR